MDLALLVYGISLLQGIGNFFGFTIVALVITSFGILLYISDLTPKSYRSKEQNEQNALDVKYYKKWIWRNLWIGIFSAWILIFLPTEKTAYTMVGAYAAQQVAENQKVQQMSGKVLQIIEQRLDGYIQEGIVAAEKATKK